MKDRDEIIVAKDKWINELLVKIDNMELEIKELNQQINEGENLIAELLKGNKSEL
jgi:hypothetical protein